MLRIKPILLVAILALQPLSLLGQFKVEGQVFDLTNSQMVPLCHVFVVGTTYGTYSDSTGNFSLGLPNAGRYEVVFSHGSYLPQIMEVIIKDQDVKLDPLPLTPDVKDLGDVEVSGKKDKKWQRQYNRFMRYMMGTHYVEKKVKVKNPYVVDFKASGKNMLVETQPFTLEMENRFTGYKVDFLVERLFMSKSNQFMVGYPGFQLLKSDDEEDMESWRKNRELSYKGSLRHFFKSILDKDFQQHGFEATITDGRKVNRETSAAQILPINIDKDIYLSDENVHEHVRVIATKDDRIKELVFPGLLRMEYFKEKDKYGGNQVTIIQPIDRSTLVYTNGIPVNPTSMKLYGYLATEGIYEMLPFDYQVGN